MKMVRMSGQHVCMQESLAHKLFGVILLNQKFYFSLRAGCIFKKCSTFATKIFLLATALRMSSSLWWCHIPYTYPSTLKCLKYINVVKLQIENLNLCQSVINSLRHGEKDSENIILKYIHNLIDSKIDNIENE